VGHFDISVAESTSSRLTCGTSELLPVEKLAEPDCVLTDGGYSLLWPEVAPGQELPPTRRRPFSHVVYPADSVPWNWTLDAFVLSHQTCEMNKISGPTRSENTNLKI